MFFRFADLLLSLRPDFTVYYEGGKMVLLGLNPYSHLLTLPGPFNYPPSVLPFLAMFSLFPLNISSMLWNLASLLCLVVSIFVLLRIAEFKVNLQNVVIAFVLIFASFPVKYSFGMGQINYFVLLLLVLGLFFHKKGKLPWAGILFGVAASFKLSPFLIAIFLLWKRDFKTLKWMLLASIFMFLLPFLIISGDFQSVYYKDVFFRSFSFIGKEVYYNQALSGFVTRLPFDISLTIRQIILLIGEILLLFITLLRVRKLTWERRWAAILCLMVLINALSWQHHFVFLIPVFLLLWNKIWSGSLFKKVLFIVAYILLMTNIANPSTFQSFPAVFLLSHGFFGNLILWVLTIL